MRSAFALRINSGKNIFICSSETPAGVSELLFHREGSWRKAAVAAPLSAKARRCGKQPRPLRLLTAFASTLPLLSLRDIFPRRGGSLSSKGEALAKPQALRFDWKLCRYAKGSPFGRAGALAPERARVLPTRAHIPKQRYYFPFPLQKNKSDSPRAVRLVLAFIGFIPAPVLYQRTRCRRRRGRCGCR